MFSNLNPNVVKTALDVQYYQGFDYDTLPGIATARTETFVQSTADNSAVIVEQFAGNGYFEERAEQQNVPLANSQSDGLQTFSVVNYDKGEMISKRFFDDNKFDQIGKIARSMGRGARLTQDRNAFNVYNNGFTTTLTNDGVALYSDSHTTFSGETVDNLITGSLTPANLDALVVLLMEQKTQDGTLGGHMPHCLLVPPALFKEAIEITKSELAAQTADNDLNYFSQIYPGLMVKQSPFLGASQGGSDTAYFLMSQEHSMYRWVREGIFTTLVDWKYDSANRYVYKGGFREVVGPISFEGQVGSTGLT